MKKNKHNITEEQLKNQFAKKYLAYALSTITQRALPDVRDGLKPVHRRLIYAMHLLDLTSKSSFKKSARVVGDVIGKFHPHGDQSVYDALVRLAQDFSTKYPLINGQGNFGNIDGDNAAAMRYTETKLTEVSEFLLKDIGSETVNFRKTYDGELSEPTVLPAAFPNLLANGSSGIAVGMATNIPPHNLEEICSAIIHLNNHRDCSIRDLLKILKGPDFPTGGILNLDQKEMVKTYTTGRGFFELRAKYKVEDLSKGQYQISISQIPYQVNKSKLIEKIADLIINKKNKLIDNVIDESDENIRVVIRPKNRNIDPVVLMNSLYQQTDLEIKFFLNMNVLNHKLEPKVMSIKEILYSFLKHRYIILEKKSKFALNKINIRLEILKGFLIAFKNLNSIIKIIRNSNNPKAELVKKYRFTENQVNAILDMKLRSLRKIEEKEIKEENSKLLNKKKLLMKLLSSKSLQKKEINKEMNDLILQFGNNSAYGLRKTVIEKFNRIESLELDEELKSTDPITAILLKTGFLKAKIGYSVCKTNADFSENDYLYVNGRKSDKFIFLSSFGKSYTLDGENLVFGSQKGKPFSSYFSLKENEEIVDSFLYKNNQKILLCSSNGYGFFINSDNLISNKKSGKKVFNIKKNDFFHSSVQIHKDQKYIFLLTDNKKENRASVISMKDIPTQEKGVGIILFKGKKVSLLALSTVNAKFEMLDNYSMPVKKSLNLKKFLIPRTKNGKIIKYNLFFSSLFRGYENNFKLIS